MGQGQIGAAIFILEPQVNAGKTSPELRDIYAEALLAAGRYADAEPLVWQLFEENPKRMSQVTALIGQLVDAEQDDAAVSLARKLGQFQAKRGERRQFITVMQDIAATRRASPGMLEFLSELFNASNREGDYCQTLLKLFDVYCGTQEFDKAAECLDRAAEVDPYESGHTKRLEMLKGKIDEKKFEAIASRFTPVSKAAAETSVEHASDAGRFDVAGSDVAGGNTGAVRNAQQSGRAAAENSGIVSARRRTQRRFAAAVSFRGRDAKLCGVRASAVVATAAPVAFRAGPGSCTTGG